MIPSTAVLGQRSNSYDESFLHRRRGNDSDLIVLKEQPGEPPARRRSVEAPPVVIHNVCRTNFGKSQVYQPPPLTNGWRGYQSVQDYNNNNNNKEGAETSSTTCSTNSDMPYDQEASEIARRLYDAEESYYYHFNRGAAAARNGYNNNNNNHSDSHPMHYYRDNHSRPLSSSWQQPLRRVSSDKSRPFDEAPTLVHASNNSDNNNKAHHTDWEHSPKQQRHHGRHQQGRNYHSDQDLYFGRFQVPPPRVSGPVSTIPPTYNNKNNNNNKNNSDSNYYYTETSRTSGNSEENNKSDESMKVVFGNNRNNMDDSAFLSENQSGEEESSSIPLNYIPRALQQQQDKSLPSALNKERRQPSSNSSADDDDDDSLFDFVEDGGVLSKVKSSNGKRRSSSQRHATSIHHRRYRHYETDDTSLDQPYGSATAVTSLQERTQAAWMRKSSQRGGGGAVVDMGSSSASSSPLQRKQHHQHQVSFGKKNTVQYYNPDNDETFESSILDGRSLNSMYTKSAESEVEDIIKDIFLIGSGTANNPGRRKIKHSPAVKNKLRQQKEEVMVYDNDDDDDETMETFEGEEQEPLNTTLEEEEEEEGISQDSSSLLVRRMPPHKKSSTTATPTIRKGDRTTNTTNRNTTTTTATTTTKSSAVNTASDTSYTEETPSRNAESRSSKSRGMYAKKKSSTVSTDEGLTTLESKIDDPFASVWGFLFGTGENGTRKKKEKRSLADIEEDDDDVDDGNDDNEDCAELGCVKSEGGAGGGGGRGIEDLLNFASDVILGPEGPETRALESKKKSSKKVDKEEKTTGMDVIRVDSQVPGVKTAVSLEEDLRLVDLAMQAARSKHRIQGCELDESYNVNIAEDISFTVLDLEMPLGLIFQENETGCWVTKVLPNGSASRKGNKVQMGDQLAAIDGISAIHMKVSEIADAITSKKGEVELTFLRYVGALHPVAGSVIEEGWEVRDTPPRQPAVQTPRRSPMTGFLRGSSGKNMSKPAEVTKSAEKRRFRLFRRKKDTKE